MKGKRAERKKMNSQKTVLVRASISFPPDLYATLEELAKQKKVSLAWVVRDAAERYVADETGKGGNRHNQTGHGSGKPRRRST
jgi:metal-responsive CopG/Arc/MetJ family transcriptional regulator